MIDWQQMENLAEEVGREDLREVLEIFFEEVEETLAEIHTDDISDLRTKLHFLKGSALNIGFREMADRCTQHENELVSEPENAPDVQEIMVIFKKSRDQLKLRSERA